MAKGKAKPVKKPVKPAVKKEVAAKPTPKPVKKSQTIQVLIEEPVKITAADLLAAINGFEGAVSDLKHLELKVAQAPTLKNILMKQYNAQKSVVNEFLGKLKVVV